MKILFPHSLFLISRFLACGFVCIKANRNKPHEKNTYNVFMIFLRISILVFLFFGTKISFAQIQEPTSFDWKESVEVNRKIESFYDSDVLLNLPKNARFWVDIKPFSSKVLRATYAEDGIAIYKSIEKIESFYNGEPYNHGLHKSIKFEGETYYSLISSPDNYKLKKKFDYEEDIEEIELPISPEFDLNDNLLAFQNNPLWDSYYQGSTEWFYSEDSPVDFSIDVSSNTIATYDATLDIHEEIKYAEVYPNIWQPVLKVTKYTEETLEGICLSKKETTEYENYEYEILRNKENSVRRSNDSSEINNVVQVGSSITFNSSYDSEYSVVIFDVSGRVLNSLKSVKNEFNFSPPYTGIYFINFSNRSSSYSSKIFLTN